MLKLKKFLGLAGMLAILVTLVGCPDPGATGSGPLANELGTITGKVLYSNSSDSSDIWVSIEKSDGLTTESVASIAGLTDISAIETARSAARSVLSNVKAAKDGSYTFKNLTAGTYTIYASSNISQEKAVNTNVTVKAASTVTAADLKLTATGNISGIVKLDGAGQAGMLVGIASTSYMAFTGEDGSFTISNIPAGKSYNLSVLFGTYTYLVPNKVTVEAGTTKNVSDIALTTDEIKNKSLIKDGKDGEDGKDGVDGKDGENGKNGISIKWLGAFESADKIEEAEELNAYYNTEDGCSYIYVDGKWKLLASAGKNGADGKDGVGVSTNYVSASATDRGIYFSGTIPSNITYTEQHDSDSSKLNFTANCTISVTDNAAGIIMQKDLWEIIAGDWTSWNMTYPLVEAGKEYTFTVRAYWRGYTFYSENITITAVGGLGEFKVENVDDLDVELTEDKVIQRVGKPEFTKNDKVQIKRQGTIYSLYAFKEKPENNGQFWNGVWVADGTVYGDYDTYPVKDIAYIRGWGIDNPELYLSGHVYGVRAKTKLEIAGYSDDDNIFFEMNDEKYSYGEWGGEKINILEVYGYNGVLTDTIKVMGVNDKEVTVAEIKGLPGSQHGDYKYSQAYDILDTRYEPNVLPKIHVNPEADSGWKDENFRFEKWSVVYPLGGGTYSYSGKLEDNIVTIDGQKYLVQPVYAQFTGVYTYTVEFMMNDGTNKVYTTKKLSTEKQNNIDDWPKWNELSYFIINLTAPKREGYTFVEWSSDPKEQKSFKYEIYEDTTLYAVWAKNVSVKLMDGTKEFDTVTSYEGASTSSFTAPEKDNFVFVDWYADAELKNAVTTVSEDTTVLYAKYVETETWWTGNSSSVYPNISSEQINKLTVGDTLYFEIQNTSNYGYGSIYIRDSNGNWSNEVLYYSANQTLTVSYTFKSSNSIRYIKNYGLYVSTNNSDIVLKKISYAEGPIHGPNSSIFANANVELNSSYGSEPEFIYDEDGKEVLKIYANGNYASWKISLPASVDISTKKIKLTAKFSKYSTGYNTNFNIAFKSDDTHGSEFILQEFSSEYKDTVFSLDQLYTEWSSDNSIEAADFTKINQIVIKPQEGEGIVYIKNIEFID